MIEKKITITNPKGIHARPSALITKAAMKFDAEIIIENNGIEANARHIIEIISLGAKFGDSLRLRVSGAEEKAATEEMERIFSLSYHDDD